MVPYMATIKFKHDDVSFLENKLNCDYLNVIMLEENTFESQCHPLPKSK